jgi:GNAT superfamily N-acetyltransferase
VRGADRFEVRAATPDDAQAIAEVNVAAGRVAWAAFVPPERLERFDPPVDRWRERLAAAGPRHAWVVLEDREVIGFAVTLPCGGGRNEGEVTGLYTHPRVWGAGAGRRLLETALDALAASGCRDAVLWTEERNRRPRAIYERAGWRPDGATRERDFLGCAIRELRYRISLAGRDGPDESERR